MKLQDLLKDIELGKVYTDMDRKPFKVNEGMRRFKVYVSGESEPLVLLGKNEKDVKQVAHQMIQNSSVRIRKVVREGKLNEFNKKHFLNLIKQQIESLKGQIAYSKDKIRDKNLEQWERKEYAAVLKDNIKDLKAIEKHYKRVEKLSEGKLTEAGFSGVTAPPKFSSPEAKKVVDGALRQYAQELRKLQYKVIKDWMTKAKAGVIDFFDLVRGFEGGDASRAHPYETDFLKKVLTRDKIVDRFRKYFGGRKGKRR